MKPAHPDAVSPRAVYPAGFAELPPEFQREVLDFIGYLHTKHVRPPDAAWLERAWGIAPDFPDRPPQPPLGDASVL